MIPGCNRGCKNQREHFNDPKRVDVTKSVPKSISKEVLRAVTTDSNVTKSVTKSDKDRVYAWRKKNRAKYNEKQKELMKKRAAHDDYVKTHLEMMEGGAK